MTATKPVVCAVTGASGFVGRGLVEFLARRGVTVKVLDRTSVPNFSDISALKKAMTGCSCAIHVVGRAHILKKNDSTAELAEFRHVNVDLALAAARAASDAGVSRFIHISSVAVFGAQSSETTLSDATPVRPTTPYGRSKAEAEEQLAGLADHRSLAVLSIRPPLIYGPGAPGNFAKLVRAIRAGIPLPFGLTTSNRRTFLARENLCAAISRAMSVSTPIRGEFIVADSESLSTRVTIEAIAEGAGRSARLLPIPSGLLKALLTAAGAGTIASQLLQSLEFDGSRFCMAADWTPVTGPRQGLAQMGAAWSSSRD